jgi:hypothetical protein
MTMTNIGNGFDPRALAAALGIRSLPAGPAVDVAELTRQTRTRQVQDLRAASKLFALRGQTRNADTCLDLADKLERFGSFISDKQSRYATQLVEWSLPNARQGTQNGPGSTIATQPVPAPAPAPVVRLERLFDLMQGLSKLRFGKLTIARKNQDSLCWVKHEDSERVVGKIENGVLTQWAQPGIDMAEVQVMLKVIDLDPKAAAAKHGVASGECSVCGRDLTDPESIALGIGPVCAEKFSF